MLLPNEFWVGHGAALTIAMLQSSVQTEALHMLVRFSLDTYASATSHMNEHVLGIMAQRE